MVYLNLNVKPVYFYLFYLILCRGFKIPNRVSVWSKIPKREALVQNAEEVI